MKLTKKGKRTMMIRLCTSMVCGIGVLSLIGCASSTENLQRATAMSIGNNTLPESVGISDIQRGVTDVKWTATAPSGATYACSADDMVRRPYCAKR